MSQHFVKRCKECKTVISQCRCPAKNKTETEGICPSCAQKLEKAATDKGDQHK